MKPLFNMDLTSLSGFTLIRYCLANKWKFYVDNKMTQFFFSNFLNRFRVTLVFQISAFRFGRNELLKYIILTLIMAMKQYCNSHLRSFQLMHKRCHIHEIKTEPFANFSLTFSKLTVLTFEVILFHIDIFSLHGYKETRLSNFVTRCTTEISN